MTVHYRWSSLAVLLASGALFSMLFAINLRYPGLFMDSVNPEYLAPLILDPEQSKGMFVYALPGTLLDGRFPILAGSFYHGPLQLYLSLPVFALFGTDIVGARVAQGMFGLLVLLALGALLRQQRVRLPLLVAGLALIAIDPAFVQAFKTQALSTLWPLSMVFASAWLVERRAAYGHPQGVWTPLVAGALSGLAFFSYFIHLFFLPVQLAHLVLCARASGSGRKGWAVVVGIFLTGFVIGCIPYFLGYGLMAEAFGPNDFAAFIAGNGERLVAPPDAGDIPHAGPFTRWQVIGATMGDAWVSMTIFSSAGYSFLGSFKVLVFLLPIACALPIVKATTGRQRMFGYAVGSIATFLLLTTPIAGRLHGHHYIVLLPFLYLSATLAVEMLFERAVLSRLKLTALALLPILLLADNFVAHRGFQRTLAATHGVGDYSATLNALAEDALRDGADDLYVFPDWGFFMPFAFQTGGRVAYAADDRGDEAIRGRILSGVCRGKDVALVRSGNGAPDPRLDPILVKQNGWVGEEAQRSLVGRRDAARKLVNGLVPVTTTYKQPDGTPVFDVHRFQAFDDPEVVATCEGMAVTTCKRETRVDGARMSASPCMIETCPANSLPEVDVTWSSANAVGVEIWVGPPGQEKKLWVAGGAEGKGRTGPWVNSGTEFEMRETGSGIVLATLRIGGAGCGG
jgi:hypothetical protein